jgi:transcriptional regulator with XRE-family HTH domain
MALRRKSRGLTQLAVAEKLGIPRGWVSLFERGRHPIPERHLEALSDLLGVPEENLQELARR